MRKYLLFVILLIPILTACTQSSQYENYVYFIDHKNDHTIYLIDDFEEEVKQINPTQYLEPGEEITLIDQGDLKATSHSFNKIDQLTRLYKNNQTQLVSSSNQHLVFMIRPKDIDEIKGILICDIVSDETCKRLTVNEKVQDIKWYNKALELDRFFILMTIGSNDVLYLINEQEELVNLYEVSNSYVDVIDYDIMNGSHILLSITKDDNSSAREYQYINLQGYKKGENSIDVETTTLTLDDFNLADDKSFIIRGLPFNDRRMLTCNKSERTEIVSCNLVNDEKEVLETYINSFNVIGYLNENEVMISESHNLYIYNYSKKRILKINDKPLIELETHLTYYDGQDLTNPFSFNTKRIGNKLFLSVKQLNQYKTYVIDENKYTILSEYDVPISFTDYYYTDKVLIMRNPEPSDERQNIIIYHKIFGKFKIPDFNQELKVFDDGVYYLDDHTLKFFDVRYGKEFTVEEGEQISSFDVIKVAKNHYLISVYRNDETSFIRYKKNKGQEVDYIRYEEMESTE